MEKQRILVVGAGVIGLTTTYTLAKHGYHVTVLSDKYACAGSTSDIASEVAAGIWQVPLSIYQWKDKDVENKIKTWSLQSYKAYSECATSSKKTGVYLRSNFYVYRKKINDMPKTKQFMAMHKDLPGFRHSCQILQETGFSPDLMDCFTYKAPAVDTDVFLQWINKQCALLGVKFCQGSIRGTLKDQIEDLKRTFKVDLVINCTGLAARELAEDPDVYPMIGAAFVLQSTDAKIPDFVLNCTTHWHEGEDGGHVLVTKKGKDKLWIGSAKIEQEPFKITEQHPVIQRMLKEDIAIYPPFANMIAANQMTLRTGARPMRKESPRVEQDAACQSLIHNYGHGGVGYILSWGCAEEVLRIVDKAQPLTSKL